MSRHDPDLYDEGGQQIAPRPLRLERAARWVFITAAIVGVLLLAGVAVAVLS